MKWKALALRTQDYYSGGADSQSIWSSELQKVMEERGAHIKLGCTYLVMFPPRYQIDSALHNCKDDF